MVSHPARLPQPSLRILLYPHLHPWRRRRHCLLPPLSVRALLLYNHCQFSPSTHRTISTTETSTKLPPRSKPPPRNPTTSQPNLPTNAKLPPNASSPPRRPTTPFTKTITTTLSLALTLLLTLDFLSTNIGQLMTVTGPSMSPLLNTSLHTSYSSSSSSSTNSSTSSKPSAQNDIVYVSLRPRDLKRGDIVAFTSPLNPNVLAVKRIIALPGDLVLREHGTSAYPPPKPQPLQSQLSSSSSSSSSPPPPHLTPYPTTETNSSSHQDENDAATPTGPPHHLPAQNKTSSFINNSPTNTTNTTTTTATTTATTPRTAAPRPHYTELPPNHLWLEGENRAENGRWSLDSRIYGPVSAGLVVGRVEGVVWPWGRRGWISRSSTTDDHYGGGGEDGATRVIRGKGGRKVERFRP